MKAELTFMGTGTSQGSPIIGCKCPVCSSNDNKDKRLRASALVHYGGLTILVDAGPDFRTQMIREGVSHLDAILLTHNHKDHTGGLDDVRALNYIDKKSIEIYCEERVLRSLKQEYSYGFQEVKYPGAPEWHVHKIDERPFFVYDNHPDGELTWIHDKGYFFKRSDGELIPTASQLIDEADRVDDPTFAGGRETADPYGVEIVPIRGFHDQMPVLGFRFGNIAYITDMRSIPESEFAKLQNLDHVTLNTVGYKKHHSHFSLDEALEMADKIGAKHTWLTHLSHNFPSHNEFKQQIKALCEERHIHSIVAPAYDGLTIF